MKLIIMIYIAMCF